MPGAAEFGEPGFIRSLWSNSMIISESASYFSACLSPEIGKSEFDLKSEFSKRQVQEI
jgi:hypothetical protein